jgi:hypothetical protein
LPQLVPQNATLKPINHSDDRGNHSDLRKRPPTSISRPHSQLQHFDVGKYQIFIKGTTAPFCPSVLLNFSVYYSSPPHHISGCYIPALAAFGFSPHHAFSTRTRRKNSPPRNLLSYIQAGNLACFAPRRLYSAADYARSRGLSSSDSVAAFYPRERSWPPQRSWW